MCGIAGLLNFHNRPVEQADLAALTNAIAHRGRDHAAYEVGGDPQNSLSSYAGIGLGHRRLSIIDLSDQSAQPLRTAKGQATIVYNGELYNYRELRQKLRDVGCSFQTDSDTEVVLAAYETWGEDCLQQFNGMFAFAIWDETRQLLFCARDPIGIKPFYYSLTDDGFAFSSESRALAARLNQGHKGVLDQEALICYFLMMYVPRHMSIFADIKKLLPGHSMTVGRDGKVDIHRYWSLSQVEPRAISAEKAAAEMLEILDSAVAAQLRSDVPVGAFLSGGFDSGMLVASAGQTDVPIHTYSVGFDDGRTAFRDHSELPIAQAMSERYGAIHHERVIESGEVLGLLNHAVQSMSEPVADSAIIPSYCLSEMAANDGVKVMLSGTGGDEVFGGYSRYVASSFKRRLLFAMPRKLRQHVGKTLFGGSIFGKRLYHPSLDMMVYTGGSSKLARTFFGSDPEFHGFLEDLVYRIFPSPYPGSSALYEHMGFDLQVYLPDLLLMLLDQLTMAHTIEGRVPLLDVDLIKAAYSLPAHLHVSSGSSVTRQLMRKMAEHRVAPETFVAKKMGFSGPVASWVQQNKTVFAKEVIASQTIPELQGMRMEQLWSDGAKAPSHFWAMDMFQIYCFSHWYQVNKV